MKITRFKNVRIGRTLESRETTSLKDANGFYAYVARTNTSKATFNNGGTMDTGTTYSPMRGAYLECKRPSLLRRIRLVVSDLVKI